MGKETESKLYVCKLSNCALLDVHKKLVKKM